MWKKIKNAYNNASLVAVIRYSYFILLLPMFLFVIFCIFSIWNSNKRYEDIINSAVAASGFNLDFKKDFDYEAYLVIVGNKSMQESELQRILSDADTIVTNLEKLSTTEENLERLQGAGKYLANLENYIQKIEKNLQEGNRYEENMEIWENDIQIVTALIRESMTQYIYYEISDVQKAHQSYRQMYIRMLTLSVIIFALITVSVLFLSYYIPNSITKPIRRLQQVTEQVSEGDFEVRADVETGAEVRALSSSFNMMIDKINDLLKQVKEEQIHLKNAELELLQAQINPHFLYNTLDTIVWLAETGESERVVEMVQSLSSFFRVSLSKGREVITLAEEMQHVTSYLEIQRFRYQDILDYDIQIPEKLQHYMIPKITLQPLVENALYHGVKNRRGRGRITITGKPEKEWFEIQVQDNGIGMTEEKLSQVRGEMNDRSTVRENVYGLYNVNERILLRFGEAYGISLESKYGEGTRVIIRLPYQEV